MLQECELATQGNPYTHRQQLASASRNSTGSTMSETGSDHVDTWILENLSII